MNRQMDREYAQAGLKTAWEAGQLLQYLACRNSDKACCNPFSDTRLIIVFLNGGEGHKLTPSLLYERPVR
jgi:hypothetical protein